MALVATELATNIVKYGVPGEILVGTYEDGTGSGVEILALDKGPGVLDLGSALRDGHSTGGSPGEGLGAVRRLSDAFDIASRPGGGTAVMARLSSVRPAASQALPAFGAVTVPLKGETANGDAYAVRERADGWTAIVADGLGHGPEAAKASEEALRLFHRNQDRPPATILAPFMRVSPTPGAGRSRRARYERDRETVALAGIGNVLGAVVSGTATKRTVSLAGTAVMRARRIQEFEYPMRQDDLFVLCSDGIATGWSLDAFPGIAGAHPALVAGLIYRTSPGPATTLPSSSFGTPPHEVAAPRHTGRARGRHHHGAPARAPAGRAPRLRGPGPDPHRHAVSEIARNAYGYAGGGRVEYGLDEESGGLSPSSASATRGRASPTSMTSFRTLSHRRRPRHRHHRLPPADGPLSRSRPNPARALS